MAVEVRATLLADVFIKGLAGRARRAYDDFEADLARRGCAALAYRLTGDQVDQICVTHLVRSLRVIVAFESADVVYVLLVGEHDEKNPAMDVYQQLYALVGHTPPDQAARTKPPCCDAETGSPPVAADLLDQLLPRMRRIRATVMPRAARRRRRTKGGRR